MAEPVTTYQAELRWAKDDLAGPPELIATRDFGADRGAAYRAGRDWVTAGRLDGVVTGAALSGRSSQLFERRPMDTIGPFGGA